MSYILDALRRADSERTRGAVPDIHAQPVPVLSDDGATPRRARPWMWLAVCLALVVLGLVAWTMLDLEPQHDFARAPAPAPLAPTAPPAAPAATTPIAPTLPSGEPAPAAVAPVPTPAPASRAAQVARPVTPPATVAARPPARQVARPSALPADAARAPTKEVKPAAAASAPEPRIYPRNELPEDVRRELPALVVGGSVYSEHAPSRMLILNGQVFREGDQLAPNLKLEQIKLKGAVLRYKEYRFGLAY